MMQLSVPRPQTVQPVTPGYETDKAPAFHPRLCHSDVTNDLFTPAHSSEPALPALHVLRSNSFSPKGANEGNLPETARVEGSFPLFPALTSARTCAICGSLLVDPSKIAIPQCEHMYCKGCLVAYLQLRVSNGEVLKMPCPTFECTSVVPEEVLTALLGTELLGKYMRYRRNQEIEANPNVKHCPQPDCQGYAEGGIERPRLTCNACGHTYCFYCQKPWHHGSPCGLEGDRLLDSWARANHVKFCPNCHRRVEKTSGCDHMTCVKCRYDWCWKCGCEYTSSHEDVCAVSLIRKRNPPWIIALALLFAPLLLPFVFVILLLYYLEALHSDFAQREEQPRLYAFLQRRYLSYPLLTCLALVLTPLAFVVALLFGGGVLLLESRVLVRSWESCLKGAAQNRSLWVTVSILLGVLLAPVVGLLVLIGTAVAHIAGLCFLCFKLYISLRRFCNPAYFQPKGAPGYLF